MKSQKKLFAACLVALLATSSASAWITPHTLKKGFTRFSTWFNKNQNIAYGLGAAAILGIAFCYWMRPAKKKISITQPTTTIRCAGKCNASTEHTVQMNFVCPLAQCKTCKKKQLVSFCTTCKKYTPRNDSKCTECPLQAIPLSAAQQPQILQQPANNAQREIEEEKHCAKCNQLTWHDLTGKCTEC